MRLPPNPDCYEATYPLHAAVWRAPLPDALDAVFSSLFPGAVCGFGNTIIHLAVSRRDGLPLVIAAILLEVKKSQVNSAGQTPNDILTAQYLKEFFFFFFL
jgi:hypothetical protein